MMQKTGLVVTGMLHGAMLWCASSSSGGTVVQLILQRIVNPEQEVFGGGGTHNSVHFSCLGENPCHGFIDSGMEHDGINTRIPVDTCNAAILLSIAKHRCALFHYAADQRCVLVRRYERDSTTAFQDETIEVEGLPVELSGEYPVVLVTRHGGKIACKHTKAGVSKATPVTAVTQVPPVAIGQASSHVFGCSCAGSDHCMPGVSVFQHSAPVGAFGIPLTSQFDLFSK